MRWRARRPLPRRSRARFDAVIFGAGGVLVLPDPTVLGPLLAPLGGDPSIDVHRRAHYCAMANKSRVIAGEADWHDYNLAYVESIGVAVDERARRGRPRRHPYGVSLAVADPERSARWRRSPTRAFRWVSSRTPPARSSRSSVAAGCVTSGPARPPAVRCIVDSHVVGVAKPDQRIFEHALPSFPDARAGADRLRR